MKKKKQTHNKSEAIATTSQMAVEKINPVDDEF